MPEGIACAIDQFRQEAPGASGFALTVPQAETSQRQNKWREAGEIDGTRIGEAGATDGARDCASGLVMELCDAKRSKGLLRPGSSHPS